MSRRAGSARDCGGSTNCGGPTQVAPLSIYTYMYMYKYIHIHMHSLVAEARFLETSRGRTASRGFETIPTSTSSNSKANVNVRTALWRERGFHLNTPQRTHGNTAGVRFSSKQCLSPAPTSREVCNLILYFQRWSRDPHCIHTVLRNCDPNSWESVGHFPCREAI